MHHLPSLEMLYISQYFPPVIINWYSEAMLGLSVADSYRHTGRHYAWGLIKEISIQYPPPSVGGGGGGVNTAVSMDGFLAHLQACIHWTISYHPRAIYWKKRTDTLLPGTSRGGMVSAGKILLCCISQVLNKHKGIFNRQGFHERPES